MRKKFTLAFLMLSLTIYINAQNCPGTGSINFQRWNNVSGAAVSNLTSLAAYPNIPSATGTSPLFEMPTNLGNNLGIRMNGYICPPVTGNYVFWIASDASGELWLSTSTSPAGKVMIAYNTRNSNARQWTKYPTQKSMSISLTAGQLYYVEALMKESSGNDNLAVGWSKPGQSTASPSEVIPGTSLRTQLPDTQPPTPPGNLVATSINTSSFTLSWTAAADNVGVTGYDVYQEGVKINASNIAATSYAVTGLSPNTVYTYFVKAKDAAGNISANSATLNVTTAGPDVIAPTAPGNLNTMNVGQTSFRLRWNASTDNIAVTGYDVYRDALKVNSSMVTNTFFDVSGLGSGNTYNMTVTARDAAGNTSAAGNALDVVTLTNTAPTESFNMRTVIASQRMPHDLVYGPDNNIWYTERFAGKVSFADPATGVKTTVLSLGSQMVRVGGQDGLMGLVLHPAFLTGKPYVYISYTYQSTSITVRKTRISRYSYNFSTRLLEAPQTILENLPGSNDHNSARISIGPDLKLYYSIGDMGAGQFDNISRVNNAQNVNIYEGKILRLNTEPDLSASWIPADNPFGNAVYSFGHRNAQGLVWGNVNGNDILYSDEHGPYSDDEVNIIEPGRNYGWPNVIGFCDGNYNGRTTGGHNIVNEVNNCTALNVKEPIRSIFPSVNPPSGGDLFTWPTTAPSGCDFYAANAIPGWQNSLLITNLKKGTVMRLKLNNSGQQFISDTIHYFRGLGRFRDVVASPDGTKIYVACDSSGSTSGPTGGVTSIPANAGSILEFTFVPQPVPEAINQLITRSNVTDDVQDKSVEVYPNPASNYIVVYNYKAEARYFRLYDLKGRMLTMIQSELPATRIDISNFSTGVYVLKVTGTNGKNIRTEKIVVIR